MRFAKKEKILKVNNHKLGAEGGLWAGSRDPSPACCLLQGDLTPHVDPHLCHCCSVERLIFWVVSPSPANLPDGQEERLQGGKQLAKKGK